MAIHNVKKGTPSISGKVYFITLFSILAIGFLMVTIELGKARLTIKQQMLANMPIEQSDLYKQLTHIRKGDIVIDRTGTVMDTNSNVLIVTSERNIYGCNLRGIKTLASYKSFEELARHNCRIIRYESEEWQRVMLNEWTKPNF